MTVTFFDSRLGLEMNLGESEVHPGTVQATVFAKTEHALQIVEEELRLEYGQVQFTNPVRCADGRWGMTGRIG